MFLISVSGEEGVITKTGNAGDGTRPREREIPKRIDEMRNLKKELSRNVIWELPGVWNGSYRQINAGGRKVIKPWNEKRRQLVNEC